MAGKFVVGYDGSSGSRRALDFALSRAAAQGGTVVVAHVLEWSPYKFLTPQELEERHKRRKEEIERAHKALLAPLIDKISAKGVGVETEIRYGKIPEVLCKIVEDTGAGQLVIGRDGETGLAARVFGSVGGALVQIATVPCTIVP